MNCRDTTARVGDWLEDALAAADREAVAAHLARCGACRAYVEQMRATVRLLARYPRRGATSEQRAELLRRYREEFPGSA